MRLLCRVLLILLLSGGAAQGLDSFAPLVDKLKPAVVNVQATQVVQHDKSDGLDEFFQRFFGIPHRERRSNLGSGLIFDADGYVITNLHVVRNASDVRVKLADEREFQGDVLGRDAKTDLALIKLRGAHHLPTVVLGDSEGLRVGDWVVAIGNPFGLGHTITAGIVSAKERVVGAGPYDDFIQTDASINPGNSGGPLFNLAGEVVGVNTAIVAGGQGIGFAIPMKLVKQVAMELKRSGRVTRGYIGVGVQEVTTDLGKALRLPRAEGALVGTVEPGSPAARAGIHAGDVIVAWDGRPVLQSNRLPLMVAETAPGTTVDVQLVREGNALRRRVRVAMMQDREGEDQEAPARFESSGWGFELRSVAPPSSPTARRAVGGALVVAVDPEGAAAGRLLRGDLILEVERLPVRSAEEARQRLKQAHTVALVRVRRGDALLFVALTVPQGPTTFGPIPRSRGARALRAGFAPPALSERAAKRAAVRSPP